MVSPQVTVANIRNGKFTNVHKYELCNDVTQVHICCRQNYRHVRRDGGYRSRNNARYAGTRGRWHSRLRGDDRHLTESR